MFASSQAFGYGDVAAPGAMQEAPKQKRQEDKQTCIPVTVRILQDATARHADSGEVLIHGAEASIVHLVGVVEAYSPQSAMLEFQLNDGSGRMKVRYYATGSGSAEVPGIAAGKYVSIVGNLRTTPAAHISAMSLHPVASADEVSYHMIDVAHAALRLRNPSKATALRTGIAATEPTTPAKQTAGLSMGLGGGNSFVSPAKPDAPFPRAAAPVASHMPVKKDLHSSVVDMLRQLQETAGDEGVTVSALLSKLPGHADASSEKIKNILSELVDGGDVFTTIDDDHFQMI